MRNWLVASHTLLILSLSKDEKRSGETEQPYPLPSR